jgi:mono/diheme cytochrome c family protein
MKKYNALAFIALFSIVAALPFYALQESARMESAKVNLSKQRVEDAAVIFVENCAYCHGTLGQGLGAMPALNNPAFTEADTDKLFDLIARSTHGSSMASWHVEEGGVLSTYEVEGLVTLIHEADWEVVDAVANSRMVAYTEPATPKVNLTALEATSGSEDPHECQACHEEPVIHADRFGLNCARCHGLESWKPALLTRHTFFLDHGGEGKVACQTCHATTYSEHTCYGCHDNHTEEQMKTAHADLDILEIDNCVQCHPTGQEGEANQLRAAGSAALPDDVLVNNSQR